MIRLIFTTLLGLSMCCYASQVVISPKILEVMAVRLQGEEGYRRYPYKDIKGILTIGIGRNLESNGISPDESLYLVKNDILNVVYELQSRLPWFSKLNDDCQMALIDLGFNLGVPKLLNFTAFIELMEQGKYKEAAEDLLTTEYAKEVPYRAQSVANLIMKG